MEHTYYALPGEAIALYPFFNFNTNYRHKYIHWYDYRTGGRLQTKDGDDLLDFLIDPSQVIRTENMGFFGGGMPYDKNSRVYEINTMDDYLGFVQLYLSGVTRNYNVKLNCDLDFKDYNSDNNYGGKGLADVMLAYWDDSPFTCIFDGGGHTISNFKVRGDDGVGFIRRLGNNGTVCNLILDESCVIEGNKNVGFIGKAEINGSSIAISNVLNQATIRLYSKKDSEDNTIKGVNAGGLIGQKEGAGQMTVTNFGFTGRIEMADDQCENWNAAMAGWAKYTDYVNCFSTATIQTSQKGYHFSRGEESVTYNNCYDSPNDNNNNNTSINTIIQDISATDLVVKLGDGWEVKTINGKETAVPKVMTVDFSSLPIDLVASNQNVAFFATFRYPRNPYRPNGKLASIDFDGKDEFVIAADFSQAFDMQRNIDMENKKIYEPIIGFRHLFHIKDGKAFAEEFSGSVEANKKYVDKHRRNISGREGSMLQVRLDSPLPMDRTTAETAGKNIAMKVFSKYYYKISDQDYRRISYTKVVTKDYATGVEKPGMFYLGLKSVFAGEGTRRYDNTTYYGCGGGGWYHRMLCCNPENAKAGKYLVRIIAVDDAGNPIVPCGGGEGDQLVVQEYVVTIIPEPEAFMVEEKTKFTEAGKPTLSDEKYKAGTVAELHRVYGAPAAVINFDEYAALEKFVYPEKLGQKNDYIYYSNEATQSFYFRWPLNWGQSSYGFGYDQRWDYNMYQISSNSGNTAFHGGVDDNQIDNFGMLNRTGLYDRLFYKTKGQKHGYFYYVNASEDPGVMARLKIDDLCKGGRIHVSAWVSEFTGSRDQSLIGNGGEAANIAFNFVAVNGKTQERVVLNSFVSGYVDKPGKWYNVYFSFIPDMSGISDWENVTWELELDNNSKSSNGADYAIDDIQVFVSRPVINAVQKELLCDKKETLVKVDISVPRTTILSRIGIDSEGNTADGKDNYLVYYYIFDKDKFDSENLQSNTPLGRGNATFPVEGDNTKDFVIPARISDENGLKPGREYIVYLYMPNPVEGTLDDDKVLKDALANIDDKCAMRTDLKLRSAAQLFIDGYDVSDNDVHTSCANQRPVVQVNLLGKDSDGNLHTAVKNAVLDWYQGSVDELYEAEYEGRSLYEALVEFRTAYPHKTSLDDRDIVLTEKFDEAMLKCLKHFTEGENPKLLLYRHSYVFPPVEASEDKTYCSAVAIPIEGAYKIGEIINHMCMSPIEVDMNINRKAPKLMHGLIGEGLTYPANMLDVPLRISLKQLQRVSKDEIRTEEGPILAMPIRNVTGALDNATHMTVGGQGYIYLAETNDPEYQSLHQKVNGEYPDLGEGLWEVGYLKDLIAKVAADQNGNVAKMVFSKDLTFREGYYYRFVMGYEEGYAPLAVVDEGTAAADGVVETACAGEDVFTIKVVPEYMMWTGVAGNLNWNNDLNWRRVTSEELYRGQSDKDEYTSNGFNSNEKSYAPAPFTKVIIPDAAATVRKYKNEKGEEVVLKDAENNDMKTEAPYLFNVANSTKKVTIGEETFNSVWTAKPDNSAERVGNATTDIIYDMTSKDLENKDVYCQFWQGNVCDQINFAPNSGIYNQQHLIYNKAWVEMELAPARWYTLSSPLQGVVAGDMYMPTKLGENTYARQETERFKDITFQGPDVEDGAYHRTQPAVYQRSWNKAQADVYNLGGSKYTAAINAAWSHVFNDVTEKYTGGGGYSIKVDVSRIKDFPAEGKTMMRLPKADTEYKYYNGDGSDGGNNGLSQNVERERANPGKLNDVAQTVEVTAATAGKYFLVGNPFMTHLKMDKFLEANKVIINDKFWIQEADKQETAVMADGTFYSTEGEKAITELAPLQGFFVEAKNETPSLTLNFTADMMSQDGFNKEEVIKTRAANEDKEENVLRISALQGDSIMSQALLRVDGKADKAYSEKEDAVLFIDRTMNTVPMVYTVAGEMATAINSLPDMDGTEVGVMSNNPDEELTLRFTGTDCAEGYELYDLNKGTVTPITEGMTVKVKGSASGLVITSGNKDMLDKGIRFNLEGNTLTVTTTRDALKVNMYDAAGRHIDTASGETEVRLQLQRGIMVVEATDSEEHVSRKFVVK